MNIFVQAINQAFAVTNGTCSVLCPGYVETEFAQVANVQCTQLIKGGGKTAQSCAKIGYDGMMKGKLVIFNEAPLGFLLKWIIPLLPRKAVLKIVDRMQQK